MFTYLYILIATASCHAGQNYFLDAVSSYTQMRVKEEEAKIAKSTNSEKLSEVEAQLTQKRIEFNSMLKAEAKFYEPWQKKIFEKKSSDTLNPQIVEYLSSHLKEVKQFSPFEWKVIQELFGNKNQEALFRITQQVEEIHLNGTVTQNSKTAAVIFDPFSKIFADKKIPAPQEDPLVKELKKSANEVEIIQLSAYPKFDDQADELYRLLNERSEDPIVLVSSGASSSVILRCLDLHPDLLQSPKILGWLNFNGKLYGAPPEENMKRGLASVKNDTPMDQIKNEARRELHLLYKEGLHRNPPLGKGFPIINIINEKPGNFAESAVSGEKTYLVKGKISGSAALELIRKPSSIEGMKNTDSDLSY